MVERILESYANLQLPLGFAELSQILWFSQVFTIDEAMQTHKQYSMAFGYTLPLNILPDTAPLLKVSIEITNLVCILQGSFQDG